MRSILNELRHAAGPLHTEADGWTRVYSLPQTFAGFAGHFPGRPIVPAVVQVRMALLLIADVCGVEPVLRELVQAKFMAPLLPDEPIEVHVRAAAPRAARWDCTLYRNNSKAAQCQLFVEFPDAP